SRHARSHPGAELLRACSGWIEGSVASERLTSLRKRFRRVQQKAVPGTASPFARCAGWAISTVPMIALKQCKDVHSDLFITAVIHAAQAACNIDRPFVEIHFDQLTEAETNWILVWWQECCRLIPELNNNPGTQPLKEVAVRDRECRASTNCRRSS